jgi:hypothetical protein
VLFKILAIIHGEHIIPLKLGKTDHDHCRGHPSVVVSHVVFLGQLFHNKVFFFVKLIRKRAAANYNVFGPEDFATYKLYRSSLNINVLDILIVPEITPLIQTQLLDSFQSLFSLHYTCFFHPESHCFIRQALETRPFSFEVCT